MRLLCSIAVLLLALGSLLGPATAGALTIELFSATDVEARAIFGTSPDLIWDDASVSPSSIPEAGFVRATAGDVTSRTSYDLTHNAFEISIRQEIVLVHSYARSAAILGFTTDEAAVYDLSGFYNTRNRNHVVFSVELWGAGAEEPVVLHRTNLSSLSTEHERFVVGEPGGDFENEVSGPLTGIIEAGTYTLYVVASVDPFSPQPMTARGTVTLAFQPIPEPSTAILVSTGLIALVVRRRGRGN